MNENFLSGGSDLQPSRLRISPRKSFFDKTIAGWREIVEGCQQWRLWYLMGSGDLRRRYVRSKLGQIWIILSTAIMFTVSAIAWSFLWNIPIREMLPFMAIGMVTWGFVSTLINESTLALVSSSHYFNNQYICASTVLYAVIYRNLITFLLNMIIPLIICIMFTTGFSIYALLSLPGVLLLVISCSWIAFVVAIVCTRFRDIVQIVGSLLQILFFLTPILWKPEIVSMEVRNLLIYNPFAVLLAIVRDPLLNQPVPLEYWGAAFGFSVVGLLLTLPLIGKFRRRIIYWL